MAEHIIPLRTSDFSGPAPNVEKCQCWLCANEKAVLAAEIERLRAALRDCLSWHDYSNDMHKPIEVRAAYMRARAALDYRKMEDGRT